MQRLVDMARKSANVHFSLVNLIQNVVKIISPTVTLMDRHVKNASRGLRPANSGEINFVVTSKELRVQTKHTIRIEASVWET
jgi:SpoU rRNA methylase family enzyme